MKVVLLASPNQSVMHLKTNIVIGDDEGQRGLIILREGGGGIETLFGKIPFEHAASLLGSFLDQTRTSISQTCVLV